MLEELAEGCTKVLKARRVPYGALVAAVKLPWLSTTKELRVVVLLSGLTVTGRAAESLEAKTPSPG
jgi:hypothetical protein